MAGSNVNLYISGWQWTGSNVQTPQATADVEIYWKDENGDPKSWAGTVTFPNDLQLVPVAWVKDALTDLLIRAARKRLGVDD